MQSLVEQLNHPDYNRQEVVFEIAYVRGEYARLTANELISAVENKQNRLILSFAVGQQIKKLLHENCICVSGEYKSLSSKEKEKYFEDFLHKVFSLANEDFRPDIKDLYHDFAAIDDEYLNWWIALKLEYKGKIFDFRIIQYFEAYYHNPEKQAAHQFEIELFVEKLNEILSIKYGQYMYLDCEGEYLICFVWYS